MIADDLDMKTATFRFGIIADFVTGARLARGEKERLLGEKAERSYEIPGEQTTRLSRSTILSWVALYKKGGQRIEALMPKTRSDKGTYRSLDTTVRMAIKQLKDENPNYTVPVIIKKLRHGKIVGPTDKINVATIYRFLRQENVTKVSEDAHDRRRFEAAHPGEIWQCDVLHGPMVRETAEGALKKAYLLAIIDDHSRLIVHAQFYLTETFDTLKDGLRQAIMRRGLPIKFYCDNGSCYRADQLEQTLAALGIALTHSRPYTPQGRGKIERWFGNIRNSFLPMLPKDPLLLGALNEELATWVETYNNTEHSSIKQTPYQRYRENLACIRPAPDRLLDYFRRREHRRVKKDRTVQVGGRILEVPVKLIDKTVDLFFHDDTPDDVEVFFLGLSYGRAVKVDVNVNARVGRVYKNDGRPKPKKKSEADAPTSDREEVRPGQLFDHVVHERLAEDEA
jgi:transposase InsO family protein